MRYRILVFFLCLLPLVSAAQEQGSLDGIMTILGVQDEEELSEQTVDRFASLERNPLQINLSSISRLLSSGLFSQYQAASLLDYRSHYGDILSFEELASVDGFGRQFAQALRPYVSLYSKTLPGEIPANRLGGEVSLRMTWKNGSPPALRSKTMVDYGERASASVSASQSRLGFSASYSGRRHLDRLVVGDFNARFGQGLVAWSGFSMSGVGGPSSLYRRPTGVSSSASYSGTGLRGIAVSSSWGRIMFSSFANLDGAVSLGGNLAYLMKYGQVSMTGLYSYGETGIARTGMDARFCIRGIDLFGEVGVDVGSNCIAGLGGFTVPVGKARAGLVARYYPMAYGKVLTGAVKSGTYARDEAGVSLALERGSMVISGDWYRKISSGRDQLKLTLTHGIGLGEDWSLRPKLSVRWRSDEMQVKMELRNDLVWKRGDWAQTLRLDWSHYKGDGFLVYHESGLVKDRLSIYMRVTACVIDNWDDRIYSYERDAPGNFNVPAYYGRGMALNLNGGWKPDLRKGRLKLYALAQYRYMKKPGAAFEGNTGLRFQSTFSF